MALALPENFSLPGFTTGINNVGGWDQAFIDAMKSKADNPVIGSKGYQQGKELLMPGTPGGFSPYLQNMLSMGESKIEQQTNKNRAATQSSFLGKGLEGSSMDILAQGADVNAGQQAYATLLNNLMGMQQGDISALANFLFSGAGMEAGLDQQTLMALFNYIGEGRDTAVSWNQYVATQDTAGLYADRARESNNIGMGIDAGLKLFGMAQGGGMMGG